jgi:ABC-type transporter Mla maintaining outer membrane lipid asymmetry ATPase subunit MlaF
VITIFGQAAAVRHLNKLENVSFEMREQLKISREELREGNAMR